MNSIELTLERPWLLLIAVPALAVILIPFLRLPKKRRSTPKKILPVVLHCVIVMLLTLILAGFAIVKTTDEQAVALLIDVSDSTEDVRPAILARAQEIADLIDAETPLAVLAFGDDSLHLVEMGAPDRTITLTEAGSDATNIAAALEYAASLLPGDRARRIILLSDGKETDGSADDTAYYLATNGVRIDSMYFDTTNMATAEMQISSLTTPDGAYLGDTISLQTAISSNTLGEATLMLYDNEELAAEKSVSIVEGSNVFELETTVEAAGAHTYYLVLDTSADTLVVNNQSYAYLHASGGAAVLIIADSVSSAKALDALLAEDGHVVTTVAARSAPRSIVELCSYDEVILLNVNLSDLPHGCDALLEEYVRVYGRSLLAVGGTDTFALGGMSDTAIEEMLPVDFTFSGTSEGKSVALMLVLDCSSSMSQRSAYLTVAKQGAIKCVEAMSERDYVGVISFSSTATLHQELISANAQNKDSLVRTISALATSRGTYYTEALRLAHEQLRSSDADIKHVIFLSDGNPNDRGYDEPVADMIAEGITVTTIGLGYSSGILSDLADSGGGRYYYVETASDLPDIMLSETEQIVVSPLVVGETTPIIAKSSALTEDIASLPPLDGYVGTTLKDGATAYLITPDGNPIYASWRWGAGTTACFTGDLSGLWSARWLADEAGRTLTMRMVETTVSTHRDSSIDAHIAVRGKTADVSARTVSEGSTLTLTVSSGKSSIAYPMTQTDDGSYKVSIPTESAGIYEVVIMETDAAGEVIDYLQTAFAVSYSSEYDAFLEGGDAFLEKLSAYSGGVCSNDARELAGVRAAGIGQIQDPLAALAIIIVLLLLADIAIRKLRWRDIRGYLLRFRRVQPK